MLPKPFYQESLYEKMHLLSTSYALFFCLPYLVLKVADLFILLTDLCLVFVIQGIIIIRPGISRAYNPGMGVSQFKLELIDIFYVPLDYPAMVSLELKIYLSAKFLGDLSLSSSNEMPRSIELYRTATKIFPAHIHFFFISSSMLSSSILRSANLLNLQSFKVL